MQKTRLVALKSVSRPLLSELHRLGMLEMRRFGGDGFESGKTMEIYDRISSNMVRLRSIKSMLGLSGQQPQDIEMGLEKTLKEAESFNIEEGLQEKHALLDKKENEISNLESRLEDLKKLSKFKIDFSKLDSEALSFSVGTVPLAKLSSLKAELKGVSLDSHVSGREGVLVVAYPAEDAKVELILSRHSFVPIDIEGFTTPAETRKELQERISELKVEIEEIKANLKELVKKYGEKVLKLNYALGLWSERMLATKEMGFGSKTLIMEGWVKADNYDSFVNTLKTKFGSRVYVEKISPGKGESPPVVLDNPKETYPAQFLVKLFSLPKSSEIDPTIILYVTVPLIYGMMLGDVFYGLVSFLLAGWLMTKWKKGGLGYGVASIWKFSALAGIVFGVIFDEWMGMSSYQLLLLLQQWGLVNLASLGITGPLYHGFHRASQVSLLIGLSVLLGLVHLALGFLLGAINEWHHNKKHAIGKLSWIFIELGGFLAVSSMMFGIFPEAVGMAGAGLFVLSMIVMAFTEGPIGLIEIPGLLGNVLSYARIAAVGLVAVLLAELINTTFIPAPEQGLVYAVLMLPLLVLFHIMNIGLAMVECVVQGGRLNLVEFYGKFFQGGGKEFTPFAIGVKK
ncbi:MAG: V-type ATP synthase subunit I [Candidatus Micrarchaeia archaeon]